MVKKQLYSVMGNSQKLDGGAMFGNVPKALWSQWTVPDQLNRIDLCCRALLIREPGRNILLETGIGAFFEPKYRERYGVVEPEHRLFESLQQLDLTTDDIDLVVLSHLHFDHAGGLLKSWQPDREPELAFEKAQFLVGEVAWARAQNPHPRDRASFVPALHRLLEDSGRLHLVSNSQTPLLGDDYRLHYSDGHTPGLMLTEIAMPDGPIVFAADLIPGAAWVHLPITMGYDRYPELLIDEKRQLLEYLQEAGGRLFFTHDPKVAQGRVEQDEKGRFMVADKVSELFKYGA